MMALLFTIFPLKTMKLTITPFFLILGMLHLLAQQPSVEQILQTQAVRSVEQFHLDSLADNQLFVKMPYAGHRFLRFPGAYVFKGLSLVRIDLVYTAFPANNGQRQYRLNRNRILELQQRLPQSKELSVEYWGMIVQSGCVSEAQARALPHGFLLTFSDALELPDFTRADKLKGLIKGDSTVMSALGRNDSWRKMLVVTDLTGSMSPYTAQLLLWFKLAQNTGRVEQLVFFNDGDEKADSLKVLGKTGGIYSIQPKSFDEIAELANRVVEKGTGGDEPENNIEALLYGLTICPQCEEVVMIADNWATPRDLELLSKIRKPIRIILCGTEEGVNVDYLNLARENGGSVHTIEEDIYNLLEINEGQELKIGKEIFIIRNGRFELLKRI